MLWLFQLYWNPCELLYTNRQNNSNVTYLLMSMCTVLEHVLVWMELMGVTLR